MKEYSIAEIFYSIQGEGYWAGTPMIFVRFAGCNLSCPWCDTDHEEKYRMSVKDIVSEIFEYPVASRICLTGGEPTLQVDDALISALSSLSLAGSIHIETNGTNPVFNLFDWVTVSPKQGSEWKQKTGDEIKIVWNGQTEEELSEIDTSGFDWCFLQPEACYLPIPAFLQTELVQARLDHLTSIIKDNPKWRLSLQLHKILNLR